ncbi:hypothetical protein SO802_004387 [Lithocarpus litseifolius]|uniref:Transmembrane protein n=1 Tax=Lithocarpus litseifolius TaxID=425828 RepID=A0AAW2E6R8_9ROSI
MPLDQAPPPPTVTITQQTFSSHSTFVPFIAVFAVIIIFGVLAIMIGRLCSGGTTLGYGHYDMERWVEEKCSSCIDGRISPPTTTTRPRASNVSVSVTSAPTTPIQTQQENRQEEPAPQNPQANV